MFAQMKFTFTIHPSERVWSTNDERNLNKFKRNALVQSWKSDTAAAWLTVDRSEKDRYPKEDEWFAPSVVRLHIGFKQRRRRDPHNYCGTVLKSVVDGLVGVGLWPDDTPDWVGHRESNLIVPSLTTVVEIWPQ